MNSVILNGLLIIAAVMLIVFFAALLTALVICNLDPDDDKERDVSSTHRNSKEDE